VIITVLYNETQNVDVDFRKHADCYILLVEMLGCEDLAVSYRLARWNRGCQAQDVCGLMDCLMEEFLGRGRYVTEVE
jgi:hypothetical protein